MTGDLNGVRGPVVPALGGVFCFDASFGLQVGV